jgi:hypothetical protein
VAAASTQKPAKKAAAAKKAATAAAVVDPEFIPEAETVHRIGPPTAKGRLRRGSPGRLVLVEFLVCFTILGLGTIVAPEGEKNAGASHLAVRGSGLALLFFILALMSGSGPRAGRAAGSLGGLVTVAYVFTSQDAANLVAWIRDFFSQNTEGVAAEPLVSPASPGSASGVGSGIAAGLSGVAQ